MNVPRSAAIPMIPFALFCSIFILHNSDLAGTGAKSVEMQHEQMTKRVILQPCLWQERCRIWKPLRACTFGQLSTQWMECKKKWTQVSNKAFYTSQLLYQVSGEYKSNVSVRQCNADTFETQVVQFYITCSINMDPCIIKTMNVLTYDGHYYHYYQIMT